MFAPLILPFKITAAIFFVVIVCAVAVPAFTDKPIRKAFAYSVSASILLFIPTFICVGFIVDFVRYREFTYDKRSEITDPYVRLPDTANTITLHKFASGHYVKFAVEHDDLMDWLADRGAEKEDRLPENVDDDKLADWLASRGLPEDYFLDSLRAEFEFQFEPFGWQMPDDTEVYRGPYARNGAGGSVWYSKDAGIAFLNTGYW